MKQHIHSINKSALQYSNSVSERVTEICRPLQQYLGINCFGYLRVYNDCRYLAVINGFKEYNKMYFEKIQTQDPYFLHTLKFTPLSKSYYYLWSINYKILPPIASLLNQYNIWHEFSIVYRAKQYCETFSFTFDKQADEKSQFYFQNLSLLLKFTDFFKIEAADLIEDKDKNKLAIYTEKFDFTFEDNDNIKQFLKNIGMNDDELLLKLTQREKDCFQYLHRGYTAKQIALELNISPRTVETYTTLIKDKIGYHYKSEIIKRFSNRSV